MPSVADMDWPDGQIDGGGDTNSGPLHRLGDRERTEGEKQISLQDWLRLVSRMTRFFNVVSSVGLFLNTFYGLYFGLHSVSLSSMLSSSLSQNPNHRKLDGEINNQCECIKLSVFGLSPLESEAQCGYTSLHEYVIMIKGET